MVRRVDFGVFLPVTNNGWVISRTSPQFQPTFDLNRRIGQLAEQAGFSYLFSMAKWRGFGGEVEFWKHSIESTVLMTALAVAVPSLRLIASVAPALIHPAVLAKTAATMDDVAQGRMGINIVSAGNKGEYAQMGLYPEGFEDFRYDYTEEWIEVIERLWREESTTFKGRWFELNDCIAYPKPIHGTMPLTCATSSERGFEFVAKHCTDGLFGGLSRAHQVALGRRMKEVAATHGRQIRTHTLIMMIQGDSDADAERLLSHYAAGADQEAIRNIYELRARDKPAGARGDRYRLRFESADMRLFYAGVPYVGGPERIADMLEEQATDGDLDGFLLIFPDFIEGVPRFGEQVLPLLRKRGLERLTPPYVASTFASPPGPV